MDIGSIPYVDYAFSASRGNRVSLPVAPSSYIYSHFRHVSGVPAPQGVQGVSIAKLKVLDSLIDELVKLRTQPRPSFDLQGDSADKRMDALIEDLQEQVRQANTSAKPPSAPTPYNAPSPDLGVVFNVSA